MDAVKFIEERRRMYTLGYIKHGIHDYNVKAEDVVAEVEEWSAAHPRKTRQSVFLEQWPEAMKDREDMLSVCPQYLDRNLKCRRDDGCGNCRREFWSQEVE